MRSPIYDDQDGFIRDLARGHHADADLRPEAAERLRRELRGRFEQRRVLRKRVNTGIVASLVVLVSALALQTDVISDALKLIFRGEYRGGKPEFVIESTGRGFSSALDSTHTFEEHHDFASKAYESYVAEEWRIQTITGWTLRNATYFYVTYDVEVDEETHNYFTTWPDTVTTQWSEDLQDFYAGPMNGMLEKIRAGTADTMATETVNVLGTDYDFNRYVGTLPDSNRVVWWIWNSPD